MAVPVHWFLPILASGYRERWPYGPGAAFHPDFAIEVDADVRASKPVVAPVSGTLIILPTVPLKTCAVFLIPAPDVQKALREDGIGEVAFYLRTLDLADLITRFRAVVEDARPRNVTKAKQIEYLGDGKLPLEVTSGDDIALLAPISASDAKGLAQLEIIFMPNRGSWVGSGRAIGYALRLANAANQYRRLDPQAFYFRVLRGASAGGKATIAPGHISHPFWVAPFTRRGLIELREERDRPFATAVDVTVGGATGTVPLTAASWAHHEVAASGTTGTVTIELEKTSWRLTHLPSHFRSDTRVSNSEAAPFHWAVQSIYMDTAPNAVHQWFVDNTAPLTKFTEKNKVTPLVDGLNAYAEMVPWFKRAVNPENFVWHVGWWCSDDFELVPGDASSKFLEIAKTIDAGNATIRVLVWQQSPWPPSRRTSEATVNHINALPRGNGQAILDGQTRKVGSHHQKFSVVYINPANAVAFAGGIDVNPNRIDNPNHNFKYAYHDVHAMILGPAVRDFMRLFVERWDDHQDVIANPAKKIGTPNWQVDPAPGGDCFVQVTRTIPKGTHKSVRSGVTGTFNALLNALKRAERFIYIEDQYLVPYYGHVPYKASSDQSMGIMKALLEALKRIEFLIIVIPNHLMTPQMRYRRREFLESLTRAAGADGAKVHVHYLKRKKPTKAPDPALFADQELERDTMMQGHEEPANATDDYFEALGGSGASGAKPFLNEIYVHTKVFLIDDVYVKCGSMNFNRRGFTYDTESDFHAIDGALRRGRRRTALEFRKALFSEHTRTNPDDVPDDPVDVLPWWLERAKTSGRIGDYNWKLDRAPGGLMQLSLDIEWQGIIDPDGRT